MTKIEKADKAHDNWTQLTNIRAQIVWNFLELGRLFKENQEKKYFRDLGYPTFDDFAGDAELGFGHSRVYLFIKFYNRYIVSMGIPHERMLRCSWSKLQIIEPVVKDKVQRDDIDEWLSKAEALSCSDLKTEVNEALGRPDRPRNTRNSPPERVSGGGKEGVGRGIAGYVARVKKSPCLFHQNRKADAHHFPRTKGAGADDWKVIPLCRECHRAAHDGGESWLWQNRHGIFDWFYNIAKEE